jgi:hypothetical protein
VATTISDSVRPMSEPTSPWSMTAAASASSSQTSGGATAFPVATQKNSAAMKSVNAAMKSPK